MAKTDPPDFGPFSRGAQSAVVTTQEQQADAVGGQAMFWRRSFDVKQGKQFLVESQCRRGCITGFHCLSFPESGSVKCRPIGQSPTAAMPALFTPSVSRLGLGTDLRSTPTPQSESPFLHESHLSIETFSMLIWQ
jgi:hypothetical protein